MEHRSIVCTDETHNMCCAKKNLQLLMLLIIDEFMNGLPAEFYFSVKTDTAAMEFFFEIVKEIVGNLLSLMSLCLMKIQYFIMHG